MREIKFRAWSPGIKAEGAINRRKYGEWVFPPQILYDEKPGDCLVWKSQGQDIEIMQYTGLKDKNGKEIYEGDILEVTSELLTNFGNTRTGKMSTTYYEVLWKNEGWGKRVLKSGTLVVGSESDGISTAVKYATVHSNIYENPQFTET